MEKELYLVFQNEIKIYIGEPWCSGQFTELDVVELTDSFDRLTVFRLFSIKLLNQKRDFGQGFIAIEFFDEERSFT